MNIEGRNRQQLFVCLFVCLFHLFIYLFIYLFMAHYWGKHGPLLKPLNVDNVSASTIKAGTWLSLFVELV